MLVLSRTAGEKIVITTRTGEIITISVATIERDKVKLGIEAPLDFKILREELQEKFNKSND